MRVLRRWRRHYFSWAHYAYAYIHAARFSYSFGARKEEVVPRQSHAWPIIYWRWWYFSRVDVSICFSCSLMAFFYRASPLTRFSLMLMKELRGGERDNTAHSCRFVISIIDIDYITSPLFTHASGFGEVLRQPHIGILFCHGRHASTWYFTPHRFAMLELILGRLSFSVDFYFWEYWGFDFLIGD